MSVHVSESSDEEEMEEEAAAEAAGQFNPQSLRPAAEEPSSCK